MNIETGLSQEESKSYLIQASERLSGVDSKELSADLIRSYMMVLFHACESSRDLSAQQEEALNRTYSLAQRAKDSTGAIYEIAEKNRRDIAQMASVYGSEYTVREVQSETITGILDREGKTLNRVNYLIMFLSANYIFLVLIVIYLIVTN